MGEGQNCMDDLLAVMLVFPIYDNEEERVLFVAVS